MFQSWTLLLAKHSSSPLQRLLCEAVSKLPVLALFTKGKQQGLFQSWSLKEDSSEPCLTTTTRLLVATQLALLTQAQLLVILQELDLTLTDHKAWYERYKNDIPVFHLNGQFLMKHCVDIEKLENRVLKIKLQDGN
ncbi:glutaredoxin-like protein C5orf63 homolog [Heteronotia binoei]|uniref:glutaredoxin-like protein C5orf63 homolog n=1 Tax=Heteronotia binoei TaxID=13085 RepID=UPI0029310924|nr:glutaredoxin-like protein C5orf63 homolog [Heteronotia binoei]